MNRPTIDRVGRLVREHPEWRAWLELVGHALREAANPVWSSAVPSTPAGCEAGAPLLTDAVIEVDAAAARRWLRALWKTAARSSAREPVRAAIASAGEPDPSALLEAAVCQDAARLSEMTGGAAPEAVRVVAELAALPLLLAVGRRWAPAVPASWSHGHCPVCGAWPTLAELRGIERVRRLRCARCGSEWGSPALRCPFCDNRDHRRLARLVEPDDFERRQVEICRACHGYLKVLTTLESRAGEEVVLDDVASVDLDVAALTEGHARPAGPARPLGARVSARPTLLRRLVARPA